MPSDLTTIFQGNETFPESASVVTVESRVQHLSLPRGRGAALV